MEPVPGTLSNFVAMRRANTRGLELAHKGMLVAATAYNLQKLLHFTPKTSQTAVMALPRPEQREFFCSFFGGGGETGFEKGIGNRNHSRVVQQAHSLFYSLCNRQFCYQFVTRTTKNAL